MPLSIHENKNINDKINLPNIGSLQTKVKIENEGPNIDPNPLQKGTTPPQNIVNKTTKTIRTIKKKRVSILLKKKK